MLVSASLDYEVLSGIIKALQQPELRILYDFPDWLSKKNLLEMIKNKFHTDRRMVEFMQRFNRCIQTIPFPDCKIALQEISGLIHSNQLQSNKRYTQHFQSKLNINTCIWSAGNTITPSIAIPDPVSNRMGGK